MIDLHRLAGFHLVATQGGYARAARAASYPITQPALHQQVRKLEAEVGLQLLERVGKDQMRPTPAGAHLLAFVAPFLRDLPQVVQSLRTGEFDGALSIQAESLLIRQLLPDWLLAFRRRRPRAQLHLQELLQTDVSLLRTGRADVLVAYLPEVPDDIASQVVAEVHPCLVVPRDRAGARGRAPALATLTDLPFLSYPVGSRQYSLQLQALIGHGVEPVQTISLDSADLILGFVESGMGWSLVPSLDPGGPAGRRLAAFPWGRPRVTFPVRLAWRRDAPANPVLDALIACAPKPPRRR
ncbi:MAG: LysR family transcriptional regulator [Planctomycetes bacterium]|nr:LysR family transcriptional regulator [Planctomycetota bacterium]